MTAPPSTPVSGAREPLRESGQRPDPPLRWAYGKRAMLGC
jgi:hypothetical protein